MSWEGRSNACNLPKASGSFSFECKPAILSQIFLFQVRHHGFIVYDVLLAYILNNIIKNYLAPFLGINTYIYIYIYTYIYIYRYIYRYISIYILSFFGDRLTICDSAFNLF